MLITDNGCRPMNCTHCKHHYSGRKNFYGLHDVKSEDMDGFLCTAFAKEEGIIVHMTGLINDTVDFCEMYKERGT